jgi:hypothetical protein
MKSMIRVLVAAALLIAGVVRAGDVVPKRTEFARYQAMLDHSPFAVATAEALPPTTASFAKDLYIANAARSPEGDMVTLASASDKNFKEYLTTREPNPHGYGIANIEWSDRIGATKVTISKDGQFASISFNQALLSVTPGAASSTGFTAPQPIPQPQPQQPAIIYPTGTPVMPQAVGKPAVPNLPTPPPRVRGVIPRNPNAAALHTPSMVATPPPPPLPPNAATDDD